MKFFGDGGTGNRDIDTIEICNGADQKHPTDQDPADRCLAIRHTRLSQPRYWLGGIGIYLDNRICMRRSSQRPKASARFGHIALDSTKIPVRVNSRATAIK